MAEFRASTGAIWRDMLLAETFVSCFVIFAVLVLRLCYRRPYKML